ncbi:hypothetical protein [Methylocucumis oryzae]|uniref:Uncharacterized protein n=1 Tax=Methylocucumis oryzae TaxID=1632867 RepID=A0A0F3ILS0_9GAMM|nr:hypothetical protein [Methylocucumis oryzae]KJV07592.1 hypothetical protein VZ94_03655 [Methylocucumis oryzae]
MSNLSSIFDGVIDTEITVKPPLAVLKELGQELEKRTQGLLVGSVEQRTIRTPYGDNFSIEFDITAPALNNYCFHVLTISHDFDLYPLKIEDRRGEYKDADNQDKLEQALKEIFSSSEVKKAINGLLAQIKSA